MRAIFYLMLVLCGGFPRLALAELSPDEIMKRGSKNIRVPTENNKVKMTLINRQGQKRERVMTIVIDTRGGRDRSLARFLYPGGIKGTALLSVEDDKRKDTQWIYMPILGRARRIATTEMGDSFMGSDLAYEDTTVLRLEDWHFKHHGKEKLAGRNCWIIESRPVPNHETSYGKTLTWVDTQTYVALKTVFFNKEGRKIKELLGTQIKRVGANIWRPYLLTFKSATTGQTTLMSYQQIDLSGKIDTSIFDPRRLGQLR